MIGPGFVLVLILENKEGKNGQKIKQIIGSFIGIVNVPPFFTTNSCTHILAEMTGKKSLDIFYSFQ
jgi:hypothetical protein